MDPELQALEAELATLKSALNEPAPSAVQASEPTGYGLKQFAFDVPTGVAKAGAGLADILSYPVVKGLEYAGAPVETFGLSKLLSAGAEAAAPTLGVRPDTAVQEAVSFLTPSPLSKAKLLGQAGTGLAAYLGSEAAQKVMPESPYAGLIGALAAPATVSGIAKAAPAAAPTLENVGIGLQRKAMGARASDYKLAKNAIIETVEGDTTTQLKKSFDNLIEKGTLGKSIDPESMYPKLQAAKEATESSIQAALQEAEAKVGSVPPPSFDKTLQYVSKNIAANDVDKYLNEVISLQDALRREGNGSLVYLNQQKKIIGENWKNSPQSDPGFWRALYRDVKGHIEKYAPEVKDLNKQKQDLIVVSPIIERGFKSSGADYDIGKVQQLLNTTGGAGLAGGAILGAATGNLSAGVLGALTLRALATPQGQNLAGKLVTSLSKAIPKEVAAISLGDLTTIAGKAAPKELKQATEQTAPIQATKDAELLQLEEELKSLQSMVQQSAPAKQEVKVGKQNISIPEGDEFAPPSLVKAVMKVESGGKQEAVSSKGATGLMQIMPATAKDLGIDPKDPQQNVEGGSKYLQQLISKYGKKDIALAAYNWGPGNIDKAIRAVKADGKRVTWSNIMQAVKVPMETRLYVNKVLTNEKGLVQIANSETPQKEESLLRTVASFAPVTGEIISAQDAVESLREGNYGGALINALGVIPAAGMFTRIGKLGKVASKIDNIQKLTDVERLVERGNQAARSIDIEGATSRLQSLQQLQDTFQNLVTKGQQRAQRYFNKIGEGYDVNKQKKLLKETTDKLANDKTKLEEINNEIELVKNRLQEAIGLKQVK